MWPMPETGVGGPSLTHLFLLLKLIFVFPIDQVLWICALRRCSSHEPMIRFPQLYVRTPPARENTISPKYPNFVRRK